MLNLNPSNIAKQLWFKYSGLRVSLVFTSAMDKTLLGQNRNCSHKFEILVSYCYVTHYHKLNGLKHSLSAPISLVTIWVQQIWSLCSGPCQAKIEARQDALTVPCSCSKQLFLVAACPSSRRQSIVPSTWPLPPSKPATENCYVSLTFRISFLRRSSSPCKRPDWVLVT